jgi:hypothetical protein
MPHPKLLSVRQQYQYACGYCGVTETTVGGELTVDHYQPRSFGGAEDDDNLIYACVKCNLYKGEFWPNDDDIAHDQRVLHPILDDWAEHVSENEQTGYLEALTERGQFHIALLRLNRPQLVAYRIERRIYSILHEKYRLLAQQNKELRKTIAAQEQYIQMLEAQLRGLKRS